MSGSPKDNTHKVYCERCNAVFESRNDFERHLERHFSSVVCETCPIDVLISKFIGIFKKKPRSNLE